jgi:hypothetical protein
MKLRRETESEYFKMKKKENDHGNALTARSSSKSVETDAGWKLKGLGMTKMESCGCKLVSYPGGHIYRIGCSYHKDSVEYVCPVCGLVLKSRNHLKDHRWQHSY